MIQTTTTDSVVETTANSKDVMLSDEQLLPELGINLEDSGHVNKDKGIKSRLFIKENIAINIINETSQSSFIAQLLGDRIISKSSNLYLTCNF